MYCFWFICFLSKWENFLVLWLSRLLTLNRLKPFTLWLELSYFSHLVWMNWICDCSSSGNGIIDALQVSLLSSFGWGIYFAFLIWRILSTMIDSNWFVYYELSSLCSCSINSINYSVCIRFVRLTSFHSSVIYSPLTVVGRSPEQSITGQLPGVRFHGSISHDQLS